MYSNMYCEVRCNTLSIYEYLLRNKSQFSTAENMLFRFMFHSTHEYKRKQMKTARAGASAGLHRSWSARMPKFACACVSFVSWVPSTLSPSVCCVCVCIIMCHIIISYVMIYSINIHDVSRYFNRCRVAREVWGCFGKVIWMACVFVRSFVSFFPPSWFCLFACSFVCVFALVHLAATPGYTRTKAWVGSTHLSTRHSARVGGPCDCIYFTCDKADGRSFVALGCFGVAYGFMFIAFGCLKALKYFEWEQSLTIVYHAWTVCSFSALLWDDTQQLSDSHECCKSWSRLKVSCK